MVWYIDGIQKVYVNNKFIYEDLVYKIWSFGFSLELERYISSDKPVKLKKKEKAIKKESYLLQRFFTLIAAPEEYLLKNGYKLLKD